jgi:branched-chain amino acid transport system permease protein
MDYVLTVGTLACVYIVLACSLNLSGGYYGTLSLCQAALWGLGAYAYGISAVQWSVTPPLALLSGVLVGVVGGMVIGLPALRLRGDYFLIGTLGLGQVANSAFVNARSVTNGSGGISGIPPLTGIPAGHFYNLGYFGVALVAAFLCVALCVLVERSPFGQVLKGMAQDELATAALGRSPFGAKIRALALGAGMAGLGGALYASYVSFISPDVFTTGASLLILSMVILGGIGRAWGAVAGAAVLVLLPEGLRFLKVPGPSTQIWQQMVYGGALIVLMAFHPQGLLQPRSEQ